MRLGGINVGLLPLLSAAAYENHEPIAIASKIDPIAGTEVDSVFENTRTNGFDVREIAVGDPFQGRRDLHRGMEIQAAEPFRERTPSGGVDIFSNGDHLTILTHMLSSITPSALRADWQAEAPAPPLESEDLAAG